MKYYIHLLVLAFLLGLGVNFVSGRAMGIKALGAEFFSLFVRPEIVENTQTSNGETTIRVLTENCGNCHRSTLPTANPKALAIFDLDKNSWYESVTDQHLENISRRISTKRGLSDSDRAAILDFIACIRKNGCKD